MDRMAKEHSKELTHAKARLKHSRILPKAHKFGEKIVKEMKKVLDRDEEMTMTAILGLDENGYHVLYLVFKDAKTEEVYAELNTSHPCPPFDDCC